MITQSMSLAKNHKPGTDSNQTQTGNHPPRHGEVLLSTRQIYPMTDSQLSLVRKELDRTEWVNWTRFVLVFLPRSKYLNFMVAVTIQPWFWSPPKQNLSLFPLFPYLFAMRWWDQMPWSLFFEYWVLSQVFHSPLSPSSKGSLVTLHFCQYSGIIYISDFVDISPFNFDSSLWFIQPGISHGLLCIEIKMKKMTIYHLVLLLSQFWTNLLFHVASWPAYRFL